MTNAKTISNFFSLDAPEKEGIVTSHRDMLKEIKSTNEKSQCSRDSKSPRFLNVYMHKPLMSKRGKSTQPYRKVVNKFDDSMFQATTNRSGVDLSNYFTSTSEARKIRIEKSLDVQKIRNRINTLEKEEEMAKKRIEEARVRAIGMLQNQLRKEENQRKI